MSQYPKVFLSYAHIDNEYEQKILEFSNFLREKQGIDASVDLYESAPAEGWPRWMEAQIEQADFVLVFCCEAYWNKFYSQEAGRGVKWEGALLYNYIYEMGTNNTKFIPVYYQKADLEFILTPLKQYTHYNLSDESELTQLCNRIHGISRYEKPPIGERQSLPPRKAKSLFFSSPINLKLWNAAKWRGALYAYDPKKRAIPVLGLVFTDLEFGKAIFSEWKEVYGDSFVDDHIRLDFIVPPFPPKNYVMKEKEYNYGKGYHIHIGPNIDFTVQRVNEIRKGSTDDWHEIMMLSRTCWMNTTPGVNHREAFMRATKESGQFMLCPVSYKKIPSTPEEVSEGFNPYDIIGDFSQGVRLQNIYEIAGIDLRRNRDLCSIVLKKPN